MLSPHLMSPQLMLTGAPPQLSTPLPVVMREAADGDNNQFPILLQAQPALALGSALLLLLVANRLVTADLLNSQSRADLIATVAPVLIVLKALGDLDITPREAEAIPPAGVAGNWVEPSLSTSQRAELAWAAQALREIDSCFAVALWRDERTVLLSGTLAQRTQLGPDAVTAGPLLTKAAGRVNGAPDYLPALQLLPGRVEFGYFPENAQGVLMLPLVGATRGALLLACDRQRGFGPDEVEWARAIASRVAETMEQT